MINRILIRNKVVQLLYSYLLTKSEFKIESEPESNSKEKRFAYKVYLNTLNLLFTIGGLRKTVDGSGKSLLSPNLNLSLLKSLYKEEKMQLALQQRVLMIDSTAGLAKSIAGEVIDTSLYRSYVRLKDKDSAKESEFLCGIIEEIISKNAAYIKDLRKDVDFSISGYEKGIRLAVETIESYNENKFNDYLAERELKKSLDKAHELYISLLWLIVEITRLQELRLDSAKHKYLPTDKDLNPNTKFIDNCLPRLLRQSPEMKEYLKNGVERWTDDQDFISRLLDLILQSEIYKEYIESEDHSREKDCDLWRKLMKNVILPSDDLVEILESKSVYWNDDLEIIGTFIVKTIKMAGKSDSDWIEILPKYKDKEDEDFGLTLFHKAAVDYEEYRDIVQRFINVSSWDPERIAFMDLVILVTAITEIVNFPKIALPVSINEYIEIANAYSTARSGQFINGVLFSVTNYLRDQGKLIGK
ncbi:MAG: hypothetical protein J1E38_05290 [Paramuribaculum sp.]|nr:hypothetical protein [Paramuribaculum sp.]